jgi:hypothetical protein
MLQDVVVVVVVVVGNMPLLSRKLLSYFLFHKTYILHARSVLSKNINTSVVCKY